MKFSIRVLLVTVTLLFAVGWLYSQQPAIGNSGASGASGTAGPSGPSGATGVAGTSGPSGVTGPSGPSGAAGASGPSGPSGAVSTPLTAGSSCTAGGGSTYCVCTTTCTITIPVPTTTPVSTYCAYNDNNVSTVITLAAIGSSARYENTARTAYGTAGTGTLVSGGAVGDKVCIVGRDATHYNTLTSQGTWTAN